MNTPKDLTAVVERLGQIEGVLKQCVEAINQARTSREQEQHQPIAVNAVIRNPEAVETEKAARENHNQRTQDVIAVAAVAAFIAALAYAVIAQLTLGQIREQTAQIYHQSDVENATASQRTAETFRELAIAQQQAKAAQDSVLAIQRQAFAADRAMQLDERAWLGVPSVKLIAFNPRTLIIAINGLNTGKTPAVHVRRGGYFGIFERPVSSPPPDPSKLQLEAASSIFAPQMGGTFVVNTDMDQARFNDIQAGRRFIYTQGEFQYDDIFGKSHVTTFCIHFIDVPSRTLVFCDSGNDMN